MTCRYYELIKAIQGLKETGKALITISSEGKIISTGGSDDLGLFYFVPKIALWFNLDVNSAINYFLIGMIMIGFLSGLIGFSLYFKKGWQRLISYFGLLVLSGLSLYVGDVYIASATIIMGGLPWVLWATKKEKMNGWIYTIYTIIPFFIYIVHRIRVHSGTGLLFFMLIILFFYFKDTLKKKVFIVMLLAISMLIPHLYFEHLITSRDQYVKSIDKSYQETPIKHQAWDNIYIGLGYIPNAYVKEYMDDIAPQKVMEINPKIKMGSKEYESVLRKEYVKTLLLHPKFALENFGAKFGVLFFYFLLFTNIGIYYAFKYPQNRVIEIAFWVAILFNSLYGFLIIPIINYIIGFIAFAIMYGIVHINKGLNMLIKK